MTEIQLQATCVDVFVWLCYTVYIGHSKHSFTRRSNYASLLKTKNSPYYCMLQAISTRSWGQRSSRIVLTGQCKCRLSLLCLLMSFLAGNMTDVIPVQRSADNWLFLDIVVVAISFQGHSHAPTVFDRFAKT